MYYYAHGKVAGYTNYCVSILIVLDYVLLHAIKTFKDGTIVSFNPYCIGLCITTVNGNPVFNDLVTFQSLLYWIMYYYNILFYFFYLICFVSILIVLDYVLLQVFYGYYRRNMSVFQSLLYWIMYYYMLIHHKLLAHYNVSILIVLDYVLLQNLEQSITPFNNCFNPYCIGLCITTRHINCHSHCDRPFQSLLYWIMYYYQNGIYKMM